MNFSAHARNMHSFFRIYSSLPQGVTLHLNDVNRNQIHVRLWATSVLLLNDNHFHLQNNHEKLKEEKKNPSNFISLPSGTLDWILELHLPYPITDFLIWLS